ncbi:ankyrin repeat domain-containing protein [Maribacter thermophilus]|uniref:ankyrin repeat domain-containing protein n=1 Tax=Maribacter thermophilus TaxID=1197874 RepID=UPI000640DFE9|nr:ankyrin repeat domain-containing protein [Maribacter thermophilus]
MRTKIKNTVAFLLFITTLASAQENKFLNRNYWKTNPSIEQIEKDIAAGNDPAELTSSMFDPVCFALLAKTDNGTIKYLLGKDGNNVDKLTHDGRTYAFWAANTSNLEILKYLVQKGAKVNIEDSHGYSVANFAAVTGQLNTEMYDFLLANGADLKTEKNHDGANALLLAASFAKDFEIIDYFVEKGLSINSIDIYENGIFNYAVKGGNIPVLKKLVEKGLPYNTIDKKGSNAMLLASQGTRRTQNTLEVYKYLKELGIPVNIADKEGKTPLHYISGRNKDIDTYRFFIENGVDVKKQDASGTTPFMNAARTNDLEVVKYLFNYVEDINAHDKNGRSALAMAVDKNKVEVIDFLLEKGADINTTDKKGNNLAFYLLGNYNAKNPEIFESKLNLLQKHGLDLTKTQNNGNTLLHLAAKENNLELLKRLEEFDIDINKKNNDGNTVLHIAAMTSKNDDILRYLIKIGADKNIKTDFEESVYDLANENEQLKKHGIGLTFLK